MAKETPWPFQPWFWWLLFGLTSIALGKALWDSKYEALWSIGVCHLLITIQAISRTVGRYKKDENQPE